MMLGTACRQLRTILMMLLAVLLKVFHHMELLKLSGCSTVGTIECSRSLA